ncbi:MAG: immunity 17 family protein [Flavobacteriaceae bacterium]|jgi:hypothetical protein|nr:immunity 17 family protein [Flavobacteriaceae bacterium]
MNNPSIFDKIQQFLSNNPTAFGALIALMGLLLFLGSVFDWNWIFGDVSRTTYSLTKLDGWVNLFGRKTARIIFGTVSFFVFLVGVLVIWLSWK